MAKKKGKKVKVLIAHDNRLGYPTSKAHKFAERLEKSNEFEVIMDKNHWKPKEQTSKTETDRREREMVKKADIVVRIVPPSSKTGQARHKGAESEIRKAIRASKPVIELFERGARDSPNRNINEKNYKKREVLHLNEGETLDKAFRQGFDKLEEKN